MLATENLKDDRAPDCAPSAAALASASAAYATSTISPGGSDDGDCDDEPAAPHHTTASTPSMNTDVKESPTSSPKHKKPEPYSSKNPDPTSSLHKADPTASSPKADPTASSPKADPTDSSPKASATSGSSSSSSFGSLAGIVSQVFSGGIATFFTQNGVAGACGQVHSDEDMVAALETSQYANGKHCGKYIQVVNKNTKITKKVLVADECPTCDSSNSVDFSKGAFKALGGTTEEGVFDSKYIYP